MQGNEEDQVCAWIGELTGQDVEPGTMKDTLKSGVILCELVSLIAFRNVAAPCVCVCVCACARARAWVHL